MLFKLSIAKFLRELLNNFGAVRLLTTAMLAFLLMSVLLNWPRFLDVLFPLRDDLPKYVNDYCSSA